MPDDVWIDDPGQSSPQSGPMTDYKVIYDASSLPFNDQMLLKLGHSLLRRPIQNRVAHHFGVYNFGLGFYAMDSSCVHTAELSGSKVSPDTLPTLLKSTLAVMREEIDKIDDDQFQKQKHRFRLSRQTQDVFGRSNLKMRLDELEYNHFSNGPEDVWGSPMTAIQNAQLSDVRYILRQTYSGRPVTYYRGHLQDDFPTGRDLQAVFTHPNPTLGHAKTLLPDPTP